MLDGAKALGARHAITGRPVGVRSDLVVAGDGRGFVLRNRSGLERKALSAPTDIVWVRISCKPKDTESLGLHFGASNLLIMINRSDHWAHAYIRPKGQLEQTRAK